MSEVKSGFRRLLELTDKSAREELNSYYIISESRMDNYLNCLENGAKQIAELRAQLAEAQKEIERLKKHACEYSAVDNAIINPCGFVMKLLEKFEQAGAENASLRERLKKVEEVYKMRDPSVSQMWQAIKNASAETDEK